MASMTQFTAESAQSLLKEIGRDRLLEYFDERLKSDKALPTRPLLVSAYAHLVGSDALQFLVRIVADVSEHGATRTSAIAAIRKVAANNSLDEMHSAAVSALVAGLDDDNDEVRNEAALTLIELRATSAIARLQEMSALDRFDFLTQQRIRRFLVEEQTASFQTSVPQVDRLVGRRRELYDLKRRLEKHQIVFLVGEGGCGKTVLAARFFHQAEHDTKIWLSCRNGLKVSEVVHHIIYATRDPLLPRQWYPAADSLRPIESYGEVSKFMAETLQGVSVLLVFDDFSSLTDRSSKQLLGFIQAMADQLPRVNCLIVSRELKRQLGKYPAVRLPGFTFEETRELAASLSRSIDDGVLHQLWELSLGNVLILRTGIDLILHSGWSAQAFMEVAKDVIERVLRDSLQSLAPPQSRLLITLAFLDEPVDLGDESIKALLKQELVDLSPESIDELRTTNLLRILETNEVAVPALVASFVRQEADGRSIYRINRSMARHYETRNLYVRAAKHLIRAGSYESAIQLFAKHLADIVLQGDSAAAVELLEEPDSATHDRTIDMYRLYMIGELSQVEGRSESALTAYKEALSISQGLGELGIEVAILRGMARVALSQNDPRQARSLLSNSFTKSHYSDTVAHSHSLSLPMVERSILEYDLDQVTPTIEAMSNRSLHDQSSSFESLLGLVIRAPRGDTELTHELHMLLQRFMTINENVSPEAKAFGKVLQDILEGNNEPDLSGLSPELAKLVQARLK